MTYRESTRAKGTHGRKTVNIAHDFYHHTHEMSEVETVVNGGPLYIHIEIHIYILPFL